MAARLLVILYGILTIAGLGLLVNGCVHSCTKHKDDPEWLQNTPAVIYRGVEYFWHDDFKGMDWDKRLKSDVFVMFDLMGKIGYETQTESLFNEVEKFSKKINEYPVDKKTYLKNALKKFMQYSMAVSDDMIEFETKLKNGEEVNPKYWNRTSKSIQDTIVLKYDFRELNTASEQIDSVFAMTLLKFRFAEITRDDIDRVIVNFKQAKINQYDTYIRFYKLLFDEIIVPGEA